MELTAEELSVVNVAISVDEAGRPKQYHINELHLIMDISDKIRVHVQDDSFINGKIELNTEEKAKILDSVKSRKWDINRGGYVNSLLEKLK